MRKTFLELRAVVFNKVVFAFSNMPEWLGYSLARFLACMAYYSLGKRRAITLRNIGYAFPDMPVREKRQIARASWVSMLKNFVEMFWTERYFREGRIGISGTQLLDSIREKGSGAIIASMHIGNWETATAVGGYGYKFYVVARKQNNPVFDSVINRRRALFGFDVIYKGDGARKFLSCLKKDKALLVLLCDQKDNDVPVTFFGQQTTAPDGPARLALRFKVPIVLAWSVRDKKNNHMVTFEKIIPPCLDSDDTENVRLTMQRIYDEMARVIREYPEQYFWMHNRFKK